MSTWMASQISLGAHHRAQMLVARQVEGGSWLVLRSWERNRLTIITPFAVPRRKMSDEVRTIVDAMVASRAANAEMLTGSATWISASGIATQCAIRDVMWLSRFRHSHFTIRIGLSETPASRRRATAR